MNLDFTYLFEIKQKKLIPADVKKLDEQIVNWVRFRYSTPINFFTTIYPHSIVRNFCFGLVDLIILEKGWSLTLVLKHLEWDYQHYFSVKNWKVFKTPSIQSMILRLRFMRNFKSFSITNEIIKSWIIQLINDKDLRNQCLSYFN